MKKIWVITAALALFSCGAEQESDANNEGVDTLDVVEADTIPEVDSTLLPHAFVGEAVAQFVMEWGGEFLTFQVTTDFYDDEEHPQVVIKLYTGAVFRQELPVHPATQWWVFEQEYPDIPVTMADFNEDGLNDILIVIQAFTGVGPEGSVPFDVPSIYLQKNNGEFANFADIDDNLNAEMSIDEMSQICADFDPND